MRRIICALFALVALCALPYQAAAAGNWTASIHGGAAVPTGDFASETKADAKTGWSLGGAADYQYSEEWAFGGNASWNSNSSGAEGSVTNLGGGSTATVDKDKYSTWHVGAHAKYFFPTNSDGPLEWYGLMGGGFYGFNRNTTVTVAGGGSPGTNSSKSVDKRAGMKFGLGANYWVPNSPVGINFGSDYNLAFLDKDASSTSSLAFVSAYLGISFNIAPAK